MRTQIQLLRPRRPGLGMKLPERVGNGRRIKIGIIRPRRIAPAGALGINLPVNHHLGDMNTLRAKLPRQALRQGAQAKLAHRQPRTPRAAAQPASKIEPAPSSTVAGNTSRAARNAPMQCTFQAFSNASADSSSAPPS